MLKLGLTGSIATGKSTVLDDFKALGVPIFSSDAAVHELYEGEAVGPLGAVFPAVIHGGKVDRAALAEIVVPDPEKLRRLEEIVHPLVRRRIARFLAESEAAGAALAVVDIPLLFENGVDYGLDQVAVTHVDEAEQRRRALGRPGMSVEKLNAILARQTPQAEKLRRADILFDTSGLREDVAAQVKALVDSVRRGEK